MMGPMLAGLDMQELLTALVVGLAVGYLFVWRVRRRKATGNCCGEPECPAAKQTLRKLDQLK